MNNFGKNLLIWATISIMMVVLFNLLNQTQTQDQRIPYSDFLIRVESGGVDSVLIQGREINGVTGSGEKFTTFSPDDRQACGKIGREQCPYHGRAS